MNPLRTSFLRNEEGASPGGGAAPPPSEPAPAAPSGQGASAPTITVDDIKSVVGSMLGEFRNGIFADFRKAGVLKQDKQADTPQQPAPITATPAPAGSVSMSDVKRLLDVGRVSERMRHERKATDAQLKHLERAIEFEKPDDIGAFAASYFDDLGIGKAAPAQPTTQTVTSAPAAPAAPPPKPSVIDRGPPTPGQNRDVDSILETDPLSLTQHDIARLKAKHGEEKARTMIQRHVNEALTGKKAAAR